MAEAPPWPREQEETIRAYALYYGGSEGVEHMLSELKDIFFGDKSKVEQNAQTWTDKIRDLSSINGDISEVMSNRVDTYWEGEGADAAKAWVGSMCQSLDRIKGAMDELSSCYMSFADVIVQQYGAAIRLVCDIAASLVSAGGSILNNLTPMGVISAVCDVFADFIRKAAEIIDLLLDLANQHEKTINDARKAVNIAAAKMPNPPGYMAVSAAWEMRRF